jgi:hypothetical protein
LVARLVGLFGVGRFESLPSEADAFGSAGTDAAVPPGATGGVTKVLGGPAIVDGTGVAADSSAAMAGRADGLGLSNNNSSVTAVAAKAKMTTTNATVCR